MKWVGDYELNECPFCWKRDHEVCRGSIPFEDDKGRDLGLTYVYSCKACKESWAIHELTGVSGYFRERLF